MADKGGPSGLEQNPVKAALVGLLVATGSVTATALQKPEASKQLDLLVGALNDTVTAATIPLSQQLMDTQQKQLFYQPPSTSVQMARAGLNQAIDSRIDQAKRWLDVVEPIKAFLAKGADSAPGLFAAALEALEQHFMEVVCFAVSTCAGEEAQNVYVDCVKVMDLYYRRILIKIKDKKYLKEHNICEPDATLVKEAIADVKSHIAGKAKSEQAAQQDKTAVTQKDLQSFMAQMRAESRARPSYSRNYSGGGGGGGGGRGAKPQYQHDHGPQRNEHSHQGNRFNPMGR